MSPRRRATRARRPARRRRGYGWADLAADVLALAALTAVVVLLVVEVLWRFAAGQVVLRRPGKWDALWGSWAPALPPRMRGRRDVAAPRSSWGRRPGWQRQLVRLVVVVLAAGLWRAPTVTLLTLAGLAVAAGLAAVVVFALRWSARRSSTRTDHDDHRDHDDAGGGAAGAGAREAVIERRRRPRPTRRLTGTAVVPAQRRGAAGGDLEVLLDLDALVAVALPHPLPPGRSR